MVVMLLVVGLFAACGLALGNDAVAYIQIFDFVDQNKTEKNDPALVLTEKIPPSDVFTRPKRITYDLFEIGYMEAQNKKEVVNASTYDLSLQRIAEGKVVYQHPFQKELSLEPGENAAIFVDENKEDNVLLGSVCHTGLAPTPGLDKATVILCPADPARFSDLTKFEITGSNTGCLGCSENLDLKPQIVKDSIHFIIDNTNYAWDFSIYYGTSKICNMTTSFGDGGVYTIALKETEAETSTDDPIVYACYVSVTDAPSDYWLPIWLPILLLVIIIIIIAVLICINKNYPRLREETLKKMGRWDPEQDEKKEEQKSTRLMSLDTFRGLAITIMIFVNFGGGKYYFLEHAAWHGLSLADFVFPWFMFMVGCSIVLSVQSQLKRNVAKPEVLKKVTIRFIKLFLIGVFLNTGIPGGVRLTEWRIPGVLQRIGFTYFVCSVLEILFIPKLTPAESYGGETLTVQDNDYETGKFLNDDVTDVPEKKISNSWRFGQRSETDPTLRGGWISYLLYHTWPQWIIMLLVTGLWSAITFAMPIPGCPTGYLGPGGIADEGLHPNCTGGAAGYIDRLLFGKHIYQHPTCKPMYHTTQAYDPEGLLGSLMAIVTVYSGVLAGHIVVLLKSSRGSTITALSILGIITLAISLVLSKASLTGGWVPINKNLWSVSFVMVTSASSYIVLALMYFLIDFQKLWCGTPFNSAGKNPLFLYVGSYIVYNYFPFNWATSETHGQLMAQSIVGTVTWLLIGIYLDRKKIYYKI